MKNNFEEYIDSYLNSFDNNLIKEGMLYGIDGGKRLRPRVIFSILKGFNIEEDIAYPCALALEMIHTYSLIHDDLPAMDNDDFRHNKPTAHKAFGEANAILIGDSLLTHSFEVISNSDYSDDIKIKMISYLSKYSGMKGMIYGQYLDMNTKINELNDDLLYLIQDNKTGALFKIACLFAMLISDDNDEEYYTQLGSLIGVLYQRIDDLSDVIKSEEEMGKSLSDERNEKASSLVLYNKDELKKLIDDTLLLLDKHLVNSKFDNIYLKDLIGKMI